jgi:hypothetical protein
MRLSRKRKKLGKVVVQVEVTGQEIDLLRKRGYGARAPTIWRQYHRQYHRR